MRKKTEESPEKKAMPGAKKLAPWHIKNMQGVGGGKPAEAKKPRFKRIDT